MGEDQWFLCNKIARQANMAQRSHASWEEAARERRLFYPKSERLHIKGGLQIGLPAASLHAVTQQPDYPHSCIKDGDDRH